MNPRRSFTRKIVFLAAMVGLMVPMHFVGQPGSRRGTQSGGSQGLLARIRQDEGLSQSNLGEIDPGSETMKLATLGLDNLAVSILWAKSEQYKSRHDWDKYSVTLNQITKLQPNFVAVWKYQGWNLSYNVSVEWDDYRDRYLWVTKGILFLKEGSEHNTKESRLLTDIGWFTSTKIGRADEARSFRRIFRRDNDFHRAMPYRETDNWLAGREWYLRAEELVEDGSVSIRGASPTVFYKDAPMCLINYAVALEVDGGPDGRGLFGEDAKRAWEAALKSWLAYGDRQLVDTLGNEMRLNDYELYEKEVEKLRAELEQLAPGLRDKLVAEARKKLKDDELEFVDGPNPQSKDTIRWYKLQEGLQVDPPDVVAEMEGDAKIKGEELLRKMSKLGKSLDDIGRQRSIVNFPIWRRRCEYEMTDDTLDAREFIAKAEEADRDETNLSKAKDLYAQAFAKWHLVFEKFPELREDDLHNDDLVASIDRYIDILKEDKQEIPADFPLRYILERAEQNPNLRRR